MNIYDQAHGLAKALKESQEVQEINAAMKLVEADPDSKQMLENFRTRQMEVQQRMMSGDMPSQEEMEQMEKLFDTLSLNLNIRRLFDAERRLSVIIQDVNQIISDSLQHLYGNSGL
ncbi:YlbF family regulator [Paenibacillus pinistramenti]|uniref:YlbF family regulator n=1 Tax=Paenibacillus pinistramenti TaxID=1768003 RepID=UPI001108977F|nr:YlbF family regulator [Paenibacillus pinistramenti]